MLLLFYMKRLKHRFRWQAIYKSVIYYDNLPWLRPRKLVVSRCGSVRSCLFSPELSLMPQW